MNYEVVKLKEKKVIGLSARTNNTSPDMPSVIGNTWNSFYEKGFCQSIPDRVNEKVIGIYTEYEGDETSDYTFLAGCEVFGTGSLPKGSVTKIIPAGTYAKFTVTGDLHQAITAFWQELWKMDLCRAFVCDFEEYQNNSMDHAEIHIYIGLKD